MGTVVLSRPLGRPIHTGGKEFVIPAGEENLRRDGIADELFFLFSFFSWRILWVGYAEGL